MSQNNLYSNYWDRIELQELTERIVRCEACLRLREWCAEVSKVKKPKYAEFDYWGKPVPGFGDPNARLLVIGLAPGAHGANRTGRVFTGDGSGDWLFDALYHFGFANQPSAKHKGDGLQLKDVYVTNIVRCAPPQNRPNKDEIKVCRPYLSEELAILKNTSVVLTLGKIAFDNYKYLLRDQGLPVEGLEFRHGAIYTRDEGQPHLAVSYHPSRQNTQTGKLKREAWYQVFEKIKDLLGEPNKLK